MGSVHLWVEDDPEPGSAHFWVEDLRLFGAA